MTFKIMVVQISSFGGPNFKFGVENFEFEAEITSFGVCISSLGPKFQVWSNFEFEITSLI